MKIRNCLGGWGAIAAGRAIAISGDGPLIGCFILDLWAVCRAERIPDECHKTTNG